jgi:acyl-coenzyme A synthetase/AMP-(fatty) acid ligase
MEPCREDFNLAVYCVGEQARKYPRKTALIFVSEIGKENLWTYEELWEAILSLASGFKTLGLKPQSRIMVRMASSPDYAFIFMAAILAGFVVLPTYEGLTEDEALYILEDSQSSLLIVGDAWKLSRKLPSYCQEIDDQKLKALKKSAPLTIPPQTKRDDPAILVYTSGSTGTPKGVLHAHRLAWARRSICKYWDDISEKDVLVHTDNLSWTYAYGALLLDAWIAGAASVLYGGEKTPELWLKLANQCRATLFFSYPSMFEQILMLNPKPFPTLRHGLCAGDAIRSETIDLWEKQMEVPLYQALGTTEVNIFVNTGPSLPRKDGTIGRMQPGRKVAVLPEKGGIDLLPPGQIGALAVHRSDPGMMIGYWHQPKEEKERFREGWFVTGDLVSRDEEGYIFYYGRKSLLLKIDADLISPFEIEAAIGKHPAVKEVGCWSVTEKNGTVTLAVYIVRKPGQTLNEEEVIRFAKEHLADFKCPKKVFFLEKLPRNSRGKLLREKLVDKPL